MKKLILVGGAIGIVLIAFFLLRKSPQSPPQQSTTGPKESIKAVFTCKNNATIQAEFDTESVTLNLSDSRTLVLNQAMSASGARYANADETIVFWNKGDTAFLEENGSNTFDECQVENTSASSSLANPASVNCEQKGGVLQIQKRADQGEYGVCLFEDARVCEEWSLFRDDCPDGGVKVTGYETDAAKYCAMTGGTYQYEKPSAEGKDSGTCVLKNNTVCNAELYFSGACN